MDNKKSKDFYGIKYEQASQGTYMYQYLEKIKKNTILM